MYLQNRHSVNQLVVIYHEIGALQPEDPVTIRGVPVGEVLSISQSGQKARVVLDFYEPVKLRATSQFINENYSLMGARRINILMPNRGEWMDPTEVREGYFEPGIAEALHLMEGVRDQFMGLKDLLLTLKDGNENQPALSQTVFGVMAKTEEIGAQIEQDAVVIETQLLSTLQALSRMGKETIELTSAADLALKDLHQFSTGQLAQTHEFLISVQGSVTLMLQFLNELQDKTIYRELLEKKALIENVNSLVKSLQAISNFLSQKGLVFEDEKGKRKGILKFSNVNLLGKTAREKAKEKAE
jgi:hypothetical protein